MNTKQAQYLKWLESVEHYYTRSLLKSLKKLVRKQQEYETCQREDHEAEVLLDQL